MWQVQLDPQARQLIPPKTTCVKCVRARLFLEICPCLTTEWMTDGIRLGEQSVKNCLQSISGHKSPHICKNLGWNYKNNSSFLSQNYGVMRVFAFCINSLILMPELELILMLDFPHAVYLFVCGVPRKQNYLARFHFGI